MTAIASVRPIRASEADLLRDLRLRALADSPDAFGSTYEAEMSLPPRAWAERAEVSARGEIRVTFVAEGAAGWVGMAVADLDSDRPGVARLFGLWVAPEARGAGLGLALVTAVATWAHERGARSLNLLVVASNAAAIRLYERAGYERTGARMPMPRRASLIEIEMAKALP